MKKRLRAPSGKEDNDCRSSDNGVEASDVGVINSDVLAMLKSPRRPSNCHPRLKCQQRHRLLTKCMLEAKPPSDVVQKCSPPAPNRRQGSSPLQDHFGSSMASRPRQPREREGGEKKREKEKKVRRNEKRRRKKEKEEGGQGSAFMAGQSSVEWKEERAVMGGVDGGGEGKGENR